MKKETFFKSLLAFLLLMVGANSSWAEDVTPMQDVLFRTNNGTDGWNSNKWNTQSFPVAASDAGDNQFECNYNKDFFVLQKYKVDNLASVKSLKLILTGTSGTDALAIWLYSSNDWTKETAASTIIPAVSTIVGFNPGATGTANTEKKLVDGTNSKAEVVSGTTACTFTFTDANLTAIKNAASSDGTFTLLINNKTTELQSDTKRTFYSSGCETASYRPTLSVEYYDVTNTSTSTNYESLSDAVNAVTTGSATLQINKDIELTSRVDGQTNATLTVVPRKDGIAIKRATSNTGNILLLPKGTTTFGTEGKQLIIDGNSVSATVVAVECSNTGTTTFKNVLFKNHTTSASQGVLCHKTNGSVVLDNVSFSGCTVSASNAGVVFNGKENLTLQGTITFTGGSGNNFYLEKALTMGTSLTASALSLYLRLCCNM